MMPTRATPGERLGRAYGRSEAKLAELEARMRRAFRRWEAERLRLARIGKRLDRLEAEQAKLAVPDPDEMAWCRRVGAEAARQIADKEGA
jgi:hypothetical protein